MPTLNEWLAGVDSEGNILDPIKSAAYRRKATEQQGAESVALPPLLIRGWNFAAAMAKWALCGFPRRSEAEIADRLAICQACDNFEAQRQRCLKCGCCVETEQLINKLALATERCPEGHWS